MLLPWPFYRTHQRGVTHTGSGGGGHNQDQQAGEGRYSPRRPGTEGARLLQPAPALPTTISPTKLWLLLTAPRKARVLSVTDEKSHTQIGNRLNRDIRKIRGGRHMTAPYTGQQIKKENSNVDRLLTPTRVVPRRRLEPAQTV